MDANGQVMTESSEPIAEAIVPTPTRPYRRRGPAGRRPRTDLWTDDRIEILGHRWADGASARVIGDEMGITRNSVLGKANRLGLKPRARSGGTKTPRGPRKARGEAGGEASKFSHGLQTRFRIIKNEVMEVSEPAWRVAQRSDLDIPLAQRRTVVTLTDSTCRWPCGDPCSPDFFFCGAVPVEGLPYCAGHALRAYVPERPRG